jgi:hypothetical protein
MRRFMLACASLMLAACGNQLGRGGRDAGASAADAGSLPDASLDPDAGVVRDASFADDAAADAGVLAPDGGAPASDGCSLPIPTTCFGRSVSFREWGASAVGDGSYFVDQAPGRLGFTRLPGRMWITRFATEPDSYRGRLAAYGDSTGGVAWISDDPCDAAFGVENRLAVWGNHGGGTLLFLVARNDEDAARMALDFPRDPVLRGGRCYYLAFENTADFPTTALDEAYIEGASPEDGCDVGGTGNCYYLAMDFFHRLHDLEGRTVAGNVVPGYTIGP